MNELYDQVHQLSLDIVNASLESDTRLEWEYYQQLKQLCEKHENTNHNHPLQWEALADFTVDHTQALALYEKALNIAERLNLTDYSVSIYLSLAQVHEHNGAIPIALEYATKAESLAKNITDIELKREVSDFLLSLLEIRGSTQ